MKKIISTILIVLVLFMVSCDKKNNYEENDKQSQKYEGLFITNYHSSDGADGELLYLNDSLELIHNYDVKGTDRIAESNLDGQICTYGIYGINNINLKSDEISALTGDATMINIHDSRWAIDGGYLKSENEYISKIKDLKTNKEYEFNGAFRKSIKINESIFLIVEDVFTNDFSLIEFNTKNNEYKNIDNNLYKSNKSGGGELFNLNNKPYLFDVSRGLIYEINTNDEVIELASFDNSIDWSNVTFKWEKSIDKDTILICISYQGSVRFIQFNSSTKQVKEKFQGIGLGVTVSPPGAINDKYIFLSLTTKEKLCVVKKINIETEEIVQEKDITEYWTNKNGKYQIADMHYEM